MLSRKVLLCPIRLSLVYFLKHLKNMYLCIYLAILGLKVAAFGILVASFGIFVRGFSYPEACGVLVPGPGITPVSPALEGGFWTTGLPGKSPYLTLDWILIKKNNSVGEKLVVVCPKSPRYPFSSLSRSATSPWMGRWPAYRASCGGASDSLCHGCQEYEFPVHFNLSVSWVLRPTGRGT